MPSLSASHTFPEEVSRLIRRHAFEAEQNGELHPQQLAAIYEQRWFKMFVPKSFGGLELSLPEVLRIEEALAWADGSSAWVVTLCSGAGWFIGFLDPALADEIFSSKNVCLAGSGAATGTASLTREGYLIDGKWKYATGSLHATFMTANCILMKDGHTIRHEDGTPMVKSFILRKEEVSLQRDWSSMGMVATGSHGFSAEALHVPEDRAFIIHQDQARLPLPVYQYPFLQLAETTLAVNYTGLAQRFLELCDEIWQSGAESGRRQTADFMSLYADKQQILLRARREFYNAVDTSWTCCLQRQPIPHEALTVVSKASRNLYRAALSVVASLYPYAGMVAADPQTEINRVWRNLFTSSQHSLFATSFLSSS